MSSIYDHAVRALLPVLGETGDDGYSLAYLCGADCRHLSCAAVRAIDEAGLLWRSPPGVHEPPPEENDMPDQQTRESGEGGSHE